MLPCNMSTGIPIKLLYTVNLAKSLWVSLMNVKSLAGDTCEHFSNILTHVKYSHGFVMLFEADVEKWDRKSFPPHRKFPP